MIIVDKALQAQSRQPCQSRGLVLALWVAGLPIKLSTRCRGWNWWRSLIGTWMELSEPMLKLALRMFMLSRLS